MYRKGAFIWSKSTWTVFASEGQVSLLARSLNGVAVLVLVPGLVEPWHRSIDCGSSVMVAEGGKCVRRFVTETKHGADCGGTMLDGKCPQTLEVLQICWVNTRP